MIKVGGHQIKIVDDPDITLDDAMLGCYSTTTNTIKVSDKIKGSVREETLFHELVHCISEIYNCKMNENQVSQFSQGLFQVVTDNEKLWTELKRK